MSLALIGYWTMGLDSPCAREEAFVDLFPLSGDRECQDEVRRLTPHQRHCQLLAADPSICLQCFLKENPYKDNPNAALAAHRNRDLLHEALELYGDYDLGLLTDLHALAPEQVQAIRVVKNQQTFRMARMQGEIIVSRLAPLLLGGSKQ